MSLYTNKNNEFNFYGLKLIKEFEGLHLNAYNDPATGGEPITIGYGTTRYKNGVKVKLGDIITEQQAEEELLNQCQVLSEKIKKLLTIQLNTNQFSACVSFCYNCGITNFKNSTLLKIINQGKFAECRSEFIRWKKANGKEMKGLLRRRLAEANLFETTLPNVYYKEQ